MTKGRSGTDFDSMRIAASIHFRPLHLRAEESRHEKMMATASYNLITPPHSRHSSVLFTPCYASSKSLCSLHNFGRLPVCNGDKLAHWLYFIMSDWIFKRGQH